jgi:hypothetical protein
MTSLAPFIGRVIAILIVWLVSHYAIKYGVTMDSTVQTQLSEQIVNIVIGMLSVYAVSHKALNKYFNPGDTASSHLASSEKEQAERMKRYEE